METMKMQKRGERVFMMGTERAYMEDKWREGTGAISREENLTRTALQKAVNATTEEVLKYTQATRMRKWQYQVWEAADNSRRELHNAIPEEWREKERRDHTRKMDTLELLAIKQHEQHHLDRNNASQLVDALREKCRILESEHTATPNAPNTITPTPHHTKKTVRYQGTNTNSSLLNWKYHEIREWLKEHGKGQYVYDLRNLTGKDLRNMTHDELSEVIGGGEDEVRDVITLIEKQRLLNEEKYEVTLRKKRTEIAASIVSDDPAVIEAIVRDFSINVDQDLPCGSSPVELALLHGREQALRLLLDMKAMIPSDPLIFDRLVDHNFPLCVEVLLSFGYSPPEYDGTTPLFRLCRRLINSYVADEPDCLKLLPFIEMLLRYRRDEASVELVNASCVIDLKLAFEKVTQNGGAFVTAEGFTAF